VENAKMPPTTAQDDRKDASPGKPDWRVTVFRAFSLAILLALAVCLVIAVTGTHSRCDNGPGHLTRVFIDRLGAACVYYRERFGGGHDFPPMDRGSSQDPRKGDSSKNLVYYLTTPFPTAPQRLSKGILDLDPSRLSAEGILLDDWGRPILYFNQTGGQPDPFCGPRFPGHDTAFPDPNVHHVDIVSYGPYASGTAPDGTDGKIASWPQQ
jgi:hypothetical protein